MRGPRREVAGHSVELVKEDAGCGDAATGQTAAQAIVADPSIVAVIGTTLLAHRGAGDAQSSRTPASS